MTWIRGKAVLLTSPPQLAHPFLLCYPSLGCCRNSEGKEHIGDASEKFSTEKTGSTRLVLLVVRFCFGQPLATVQLRGGSVSSSAFNNLFPVKLISP